MIHTILITHRIDYIGLYNSIFKNLETLSKNHGLNFYKTNEGYITNALKEEGFTEILLSKFKINTRYKHDYMQLTIQLNPTKLLNKDITELTKEKDLEEVEKRFNEIIDNQVHSELETFFYWILNRVDYAVNIPTPYVKEYIKLFQRTEIPHSFKIPYDKESKVRKHKEGSLYLFNKSVRINFYDKENERLNNDEVVESAKNILRLEVQCLKNKTNSLKKKYNFDAKILGNYLSEEKSTEQLVNYYYKTIGTGDFYKLDKAIEIINNSKATPGTKEKLINVLEEVNKARSIWKAKENTSYSEDSFKRYLKQIRELGVNPATIPRRWEVEKLDSINIYNYI